jgi:hypothetical protein
LLSPAGITRLYAWGNPGDIQYRICGGRFANTSPTLDRSVCGVPTDV